jgi:hypothetical protein
MSLILKLNHVAESLLKISDESPAQEITVSPARNGNFSLRIHDVMLSNTFLIPPYLQSQTADDELDLLKVKRLKHSAASSKEAGLEL